MPAKHRSFRPAFKADLAPTSWEDLTKRRIYLLLSILIAFTWIPAGYLLVWLASSVGLHDHLAIPFLVTMYVIGTLAYLFLSYIRLSSWRCPECNELFFLLEVDSSTS